jgi:nucleoside-triphosphatase THEP1
MSGSVVVLSGERGVGKSTVCCKTAARSQSRGYTCGGLITLRQPYDALDVLDVSSGDTRRLTLASEVAPAVVQGRFRFDPTTLVWGNDVLTRATPCHLLVVDELGPLEFEQGLGWRQAFEVLRGDDFVLALVVVRPELVEEAQLRLSADPITVLAVTLENRDDLPIKLVEMLEGD